MADKRKPKSEPQPKPEPKPRPEPVRPSPMTGETRDL
jgi:hypothetical protein